MPDGKRELDDKDKYHRTQMQKEMILEALKERGCRITKQRRVLLTIILDDTTTYHLSAKKWNSVVQAGLKAFGYLRNQKIESITVKPCDCKKIRKRK